MYCPIKLPSPWLLELDAQVMSDPDLLYIRMRDTSALVRHGLTVKVVDPDLNLVAHDRHSCRTVAPGDRFGWIWPLATCPGQKEHLQIEVSFANGWSGSVILPLSSAEGRAELVPDEPLLVNRRANRTLRYTAGPNGIAVGGSIRISMYCNKQGWLNTLQTQEPDAPGYLAVRCSDEHVKPAVLVDRHRFGPKGFRVIVTGAGLAEGETLEVDMLGIGGLDPDLWSAPGQHAWRDVPLWVLEDPLGLGDGHYLVCRNDRPTLTLLPADAAWLRVTLPSVVTPGEKFSAHIAAFDEFHNLATGLRGTVAVECADTRRIVQMDEGRGVAEGLSFDRPGIYRVRATHSARDLSALSNPVRCVTGTNDTKRLYWGDIHVHTAVSDSVGTPDCSYAMGRDIMRLDFVAVTDHDFAFGRDTGVPRVGDGDMYRSRAGMTLQQWHDLKPLVQFWGEDSWEYICQAADRFYVPGRFVTLKGFELTMGQPLIDGSPPGHRNVYYRDEGPFLSSQDDAINTPEKLWAALVEGQAMTVPHSPAYTAVETGTDWRHYDARFDRVVEIFSSHGTSEFFGNPVPLEEHRTDAASGYVRKALNLGYHLGIIASTDGHAGIPAWTNPRRWRGKGAMVAVWAENLTREAVFDALWNRRCYGVEGGARIILDLTVNGEPMGSEIEGEDEIRLFVFAAAEDVIREVAVIRDGEEIFHHRGQTFIERFEYVDREEIERERYYYVRVTQADGRRAWSSPIWVRPAKQAFAEQE